MKTRVAVIIGSEYDMAVYAVPVTVTVKTLRFVARSDIYTNILTYLNYYHTYYSYPYRLYIISPSGVLLKVTLQRVNLSMIVEYRSHPHEFISLKT